MGYAHDILSKNLSPIETCHEILKAAWSRHSLAPVGDYEEFVRKLSHLSPGERAIIATNDFMGEYDCNGLDDYFANTECRQAHEACAGFELFGMKKAAQLLQEAVSAAGIPNPIPINYQYPFFGDDEKMPFAGRHSIISQNSMTNQDEIGIITMQSFPTCASTRVIFSNSPSCQDKKQMNHLTSS